jgi:hypothetical protein
MRKQLAAVAVGASLLAGAGAGAALMTPVIATAADGSSGSSDSSGSSNGSTNGDATERPERGQWVRDALQGLVEDGTINQEQATAVAEALEAAKPEGPMGGHRFGPGPGLEAAAEAIGIEASALRSALQDGQTIAQVAEANDVAVQTVIDAIVAEMNSHLDEAVTNGRLTQEQADEMKANATERATALVNGERPAFGGGGPGGPPPGAPGFDGPEGDGSDGATSSSTSTSAA